MSSSLVIRNTLEQALEGVAPALSTAWENADFTPPVATTAYQSATILFAEPDNATYGSNFQEIGILQVDLNYPEKTGAGAAYTRAEYMRSVFARGRSFVVSGNSLLFHEVSTWWDYFTQEPVQSSTVSGTSVTIMRTPEILPGRNVDGRYVLPVRIRFFANVTI